MRPLGCLPWFELHRRRLLLPLLPSIQSIRSIQSIQPILNTRVVPTVLLNQPHPTHYPQHLERLLRPTVPFTARARSQYPLPMSRLTRSIQDTATIRSNRNIQIAPTCLQINRVPWRLLRAPLQTQSQLRRPGA